MHPTLTPSDFFTTLQHENILVEKDLNLSQFSFKEIGGIVPGRVHWLQCIINGQTGIDIERNEPDYPEQVLRKSTLAQVAAEMHMSEEAFSGFSAR